MNIGCKCSTDLLRKSTQRQHLVLMPDGISGLDNAIRRIIRVSHVDYIAVLLLQQLKLQCVDRPHGCLTVRRDDSGNHFFLRRSRRFAVRQKVHQAHPVPARDQQNSGVEWTSNCRRRAANEIRPRW